MNGTLLQNDYLYDSNRKTNTKERHEIILIT